VTEMVPANRLVAANGWIEVSIVCAVLLGTVAGGGLVSALVRGSAAAHAALALAQAAGLPWPSTLLFSMALLLLVYGLAALLQLGVPDSGARYARQSIHPVALLADFWRANRRLWADAEGGLSLTVTTLFWGVGATLQFAVLRWAVDRLGLSLGQAAYLQAVVALGVVAGAALAGRCVPLRLATRVLPAGVALGALISGIALLSDLRLALPLLVLVGAVGGVLVVPMNALLQHRGHSLLTAGRSIAVQGFNENLSILLMLGSYAGLLAAQAPMLPLMSGFGLLVAAARAALIWHRRCRPALATAPSGAERADAPPL